MSLPKVKDYSGHPNDVPYSPKYKFCSKCRVPFSRTVDNSPVEKWNRVTGLPAKGIVFEFIVCPMYYHDKQGGHDWWRKETIYDEND